MSHEHNGLTAVKQSFIKGRSSEKMGGVSLIVADCVSPEAFIIGFVALKENDTPVCGNGIENDGQARAGLVRIGSANPRPGGLLAAR